MALLTNINGKFSVSDAGAVTFNDAFTFPTADGTANYILKTNGSGQLAWAANPDEGVTRSGTVANNRLALWKNDDEIKSTSSLFYASQYFTVGSGTGGGFAALRINADPIGELYLDFTEGSNYVKRASIQVDTSDNITIKNTSSNTLALTIDSSQNAIFEEDVDAGNFKINGGQGSDGQVMTSTGSGVAWETPTTGTVTGTGVANKVAYWTSATNIDDGPITFASNNSTFGGGIDVGTYIRTADANTDYNVIQRSSASTALYVQQRGTGNIVDFQSGTQTAGAAASALFITAGGTATFSGDVNINKKLSVGGLNGTNSQLTLETPTVAAGGTLGASVFGFTGTSETTSTSGVVTPTNQIQFKPAMPAGYGVDGYNSVLEQQSGGTRIFYFRTSGASHLSIDVEHNGTFGGGIFANTGAFTGLVSGITPTAAANFTTKAYVDGVVGSYLPLAGGIMAGTIDMNNNSLIDVGTITFNDPGVNEGIKWNGGNLWQIYESPDNQTNAAGSLQFVQNTTRRFSIDTAGNLDIPTATVGGGNIIMQNSHFVNKRFLFDNLVSNSPTAYMILCENSAYSDVNGIITMDRTSGLRHACSIQVLVSAGSSLTPVGGLKAMGTAGNGTPFYELVTCDYDDGTGSSSHIAVQMSNPDGYYETSGAYFTGRITNSNDGVIVPVLPAAVSNVALFQSNTIHSFQGNLTVNQGNIGVGNSTPSFAVNTNYSMQGSPLAYLNGTANNQTVTNNIGVTHSSTAVGSGSEGGLYLANNDNTVGAPSPIIFFSAKGASNTYNHAYAAIYGIKTGSGSDSNWNRGDLIFATGAGTGPSKRMTISRDGYVGIGVGNDVPQHKLDVRGSGTLLQLKNTDATTVNATAQILTQSGSAQGTAFVANQASTSWGGASSYNFSTNVGPIAFFTAGNSTNSRILIEAGGQVGVNNSIPSATLHLTALSSNGVPFKLQGHASTTTNQMLIYTTKLPSTSWYYLVGQSVSAAGNQIIIYGNGNIQNANNSYGQISDIRLKENIVDATPKLEDIKKLKVKNFNFIGDDLKQIGLIAQEVEEVFPGLIDEDKQPDIEDGPEGEVYKSVKYSVLVPMLVKAMQEQQEIIENLKTRIEQLEN